MNKNGNIGVTSENIFPIIKKFLYSDHEIFYVNWFQTLLMQPKRLKPLLLLENLKENWAI